ncbi:MULTISPECIES: lipopolysaccharide biosynthesis protein [Methylobacterium]|uniref:Polysaccharide biosynthesis protein n=1 Tax=Methylobacterium thuringiense TaxID=1003091 RepID=A0ABQ4TQV8_9HYPH|nr:MULTISPECIES: oligosaccharide flippase family protein [Methylobacterium]TXN22023.1 oligosaccharide flippase family protein [Methylobacterium sp. WL9]GJE56497.1 hypothetical protein EKPJFOCH_3003 [Methylobacterium thuringiense]
MAAGLSFDATVGRLKAARSGAGLSAVSVFAVRIAAAGFAYAAQVLMVRLMGGTEYGIFATVWVWMTILGHTATLGLSQGACRFLPAAEARGHRAEMRGFLAGGAAASMAGGLAVSLIGLVALRAEGHLLAGPYGVPIVIGALVLPLLAFQDYLEGVARSRNWAVLAIAPPYLLRQGLMMAAMVVAVLAGAPAKASVALACMLLATGIAVTVQGGLLLVRLGPPLLRGERRYRWREWMTACLPIAAVELAAAAFAFVDVLVLGLLMPPAAVGLYFAATRIQQLVILVHYAASAATAQRFTAAKAQGDMAGLDNLVRDQARWVLGATALVGAGTVIAAPLLLGLFGPEFRESLPVLTVLVVGSVGASLFGPGEDLLTMLGGEKLCAGITVAMLGLGAVLCFALVPWLGLIGAALAMACVTILRAAAMAVGARAIHGIATPAFSQVFARRTGR